MAWSCAGCCGCWASTRRFRASTLAGISSAVPHTVAFGVTRTVAAKTPMVAFEGGQYSVPWTLLGQPVWVRAHGTGEDEQERRRLT